MGLFVFLMAFLVSCVDIGLCSIFTSFGSYFDLGCFFYFRERERVPWVRGGIGGERDGVPGGPRTRHRAGHGAQSHDPGIVILAKIKSQTQLTEPPSRPNTSSFENS